MSTSIRPIDKTSVHRICSGQVVFDLAIATKELIENSLDAGATCIEVRYKEYGAECIEVVDNGTGIDPSNYEFLARKHHTSKLTNFSDLTTVRTFGFRGEALSSLCALSELTVTTCTEGTSPVGVRLEFDKNGKTEKKSSVARERGTTVTVSRLFHPLPVRRKELLRTAKREYGKALSLIQAYAIIAEGVRIQCSHQGAKGARQTVVSTTGTKTLRENIGSVFGSKILSSIIPFDLCLEPSSTKSESSTIRISGYISKPTMGAGRAASDRQFCFVNRRPCEIPKISKAINEIYRSFNTNQFPFIVANLTLNTDTYDVNVSPDKRTIFVHDEMRIVEQIKEKFGEFFGPFRSIFAVNQVSETQTRPALSKSDDEPSQIHDSENSRTGHILPPSSFVSDDTQPARNTEIQTRSRTEEEAEEVAMEFSSVSNDTQLIHALDVTQVPKWEESVDEETVLEMVCLNEDIEDSAPVQLSRFSSAVEETDVGQGSAMEEMMHSSNDVQPERDFDEADDIDPSVLTSSSSSNRSRNLSASLDSEFQTTEKERSGSGLGLERFRLGGINASNNEVRIVKRQKTLLSFGVTKTARDGDIDDDEEQDLDVTEVEDENELDQSTSSQDPTAVQSAPHQDRQASPPAPSSTSPPFQKQQTHTITLDLSRFFDGRFRTDSANTRDSHKKNTAGQQRIVAGISESNAQAERELNRVIQKTDFARMKVVGQFNLGFIVTKLKRGDSGKETSEEYQAGGGEDLFIIDQHASDEKFNFETLQEVTEIHSQRLISPRSLELTAMEECVAIENRHVLERNGFKISVDDDSPPGRKLKLLTMPYSKNTVFDIQDLEEIIYKLADAPGRMVRSSRVSAMFASRACRKSVMIGDPLSRTNMKKIVLHMGEIDQPWNCPHGRPTMRHLFDLSTCGHGALQRRRIGKGSLYRELGIGPP